MPRVRRILKRIAISVSLFGLVVPFTDASAAPAKGLRVCVNKAKGSVRAKSSCSSSELTFSEKSYSAGRSGVVYVAKKGAKYKTVRDALISLEAAGASAESPLVVRVGPGTFILPDSIIVPPYVTLEGTGQEATIIQTPSGGGVGLNSNATLRRLKVKSAITEDGRIVVQGMTGASNVVIEDVAVELSGAYSNQVAVYILGDNSTVKRVSITSPTNSAGGTGIAVEGDAVVIDDVEMSIFGASTGLSLINGSSVTARNLRISLTAV